MFEFDLGKHANRIRKFVPDEEHPTVEINFTIAAQLRMQFAIPPQTRAIIPPLNRATTATLPVSQRFDKRAGGFDFRVGLAHLSFGVGQLGFSLLRASFRRGDPLGQLRDLLLLRLNHRPHLLRRGKACSPCGADTCKQGYSRSQNTS